MMQSPAQVIPGVPPANDAFWSHQMEAMMRASPAFFASRMLIGAREPPYNGRFVISWHHLEWDALAMTKANLCIIASRNSGKSLFWSMAFVLHFAWFHPDMATFIVSATSDMAATIMARISRQLDMNPALQALVPTGSRRKKWNTTNLVLANGHEIRVCGMGTKQRGFHPDLLIGDDILTDETAWSETIRKRQADYWHGAVTPMLNPGRQQIVVCTPQAQNDLIMGDLRINPEYVFKSYPAIEKGVALWPERLSLDYLNKEKAKMGATRFSKEYLCLPVSDAASLFPMSLYALPHVMQHEMVLGLPADYWRARGCVLFMGVDFAVSSAVGADYTVVWTIGIDKHGVQWIVDIHRSHGLPYNEQEALIMGLGYKYRPAVMLLESNQAQRIFGDELIRKTDLPIKQYNTGAEKHALDRGVPSLKLLLENGKMRIPRGDKPSREMTDLWMEEMHNFTFQNGRVLSVGAHDDTVMACIGPGAIVTTVRGGVPIEDVAVGDLVLTHRGRWQRVTKVMSREYDGLAYTMKVSGGLPFLITPEHPVLRALPTFDSAGKTNRMTPDEGTWAFVPASQLRAGRKHLGDYVLSPRPVWPDFAQVIDLAEYVLMERNPRGGNCWKVSDTHIWWRADRRIPRFLKVDAELCFVIGLYLAEGSVGGGGGPRASQKHTVGFGLHVREHYIADYLQPFFAKRFKAATYRTIDPGSGQSLRFTANSVPAAAFFSRMGKSDKKGMPQEFMGWPVQLRRWIVRGWLVGDGSMSRTAYGDLVRGFSISRKLTDQMRWIMHDLGLHPTVNRGANKVGEDNGFCTARHQGYMLALTVHDTPKLLRRLNKVEARRWVGNAYPKARKYVNRRAVPVVHGVAQRIAKMAEVSYAGTVYNFEVETDHSYCVENTVVHNCWLANQAARSSTFSFSFGDTVIDASQTGDTIPEPPKPHGQTPNTHAPANPNYDPFGFGTAQGFARHSF